MELLGNQKVNVLVVFFQRRETIGIPAHKKCRSQRIVTRRQSSDVGHAAMPAFPRGPWFLFRLERLIFGFCIRQQPCGQVHADRDSHEKIGEQKG